MPASSGDPVTTALRLSLHNSREQTGDIDKRLAVSCSRVFSTQIVYEPSPSYQSKVLNNLKNKYILLKGSKSAEEETEEEEMKLEADAVLPTPKLTLFPAEKLELGWRGTVPVGSGLINLGNSCYLNSTLQALFHTPALANYLVGDASKHLKTCQASNPLHEKCLICAMHKTLMMTRHSIGPCRPMLIFNNLRLICKTMSQYRQEDAHEFLRYLIESMEKAFLTTYRGNSLDSYSKETTPMNQIFGGYLRTEVQCMRCQAVSTSFQHTQDLILDVRHVSTLVDALSGFFANERLEQNDYTCGKCHQRVCAFKRFYLEKAPRVLCIQLKRFTVDGKISKRVAIPQHLNLARFLAPRGAHAGHRATYSFVSLVSHIGHSPNSGHYTATARASTGALYTFDDSIVRSATLNAHDSNAYLIVYEKDRDTEPKPPTAKPAFSPRPVGVALPMPKPQQPLFNGQPSPKPNGLQFAPKLIGQPSPKPNGQQFGPKLINQPSPKPNGQQFGGKLVGQPSPKPNGQLVAAKFVGQPSLKPNGQQSTSKLVSQHCSAKQNGYPTKPPSLQFVPKLVLPSSSARPAATGQHAAAKVSPCPRKAAFCPRPLSLVPYDDEDSSDDAQPFKAPAARGADGEEAGAAVRSSPAKSNGASVLKPNVNLFRANGTSGVRIDGQSPAKTNGHLLARANGHSPTKTNGLSPVKTNGHFPVKTNGHLNFHVKPNGHSPMKPNGHTPIKSNGHSPVKSNGLFPVKANGLNGVSPLKGTKWSETGGASGDQQRPTAMKEYDAAGSGWSVSEAGPNADEVQRKCDDKRKRESSVEPAAKKPRVELPAEPLLLPTKAGVPDHRAKHFDYRPEFRRQDYRHGYNGKMHHKDANNRRKNDKAFVQFADKPRQFGKQGGQNYYNGRPNNGNGYNHYSYNKHHYHKNNRQNWR